MKLTTSRQVSCLTKLSCFLNRRVKVVRKLETWNYQAGHAVDLEMSEINLSNCKRNQLYFVFLRCA